MENDVKRLPVAPACAGRLSLNDVKALARDLHCHPERIALWVEEMTVCDDRRTMMNMAWVLTHLDKDDKLASLAPLRDRLIDFAMGNLTVRRGIILSLLLDLPAGDDLRVDFLNYCLEHIGDAREHDSSRAAMIYLAARMCRPYPELTGELNRILELLPPGLPPSIACARRKAQCDTKPGLNGGRSDW